MKKTLLLVAGARPNFMKIAPLARSLDRRGGPLAYRIVHTGQHYDREMSHVFFEELGIPDPAHHLEGGSGSHSEQTARIMVAFEKLCTSSPPDAVIVVGDVNSTLACSIVAKKMHIPVAHVEAGLRSGDRSMPEEINRLVTDSIADWFFVTEPAGVAHLLAEGKPASAIHHVGHVMVDNLLYQRDQLARRPPVDGVSSTFKQTHKRYGVVTMHRPSNVDAERTLRRLAGALAKIATQLPLAFTLHPRTQASLKRFGIGLDSNITPLPPLGYMEFLSLWKDAAVVLTDSGGLQEETTALGVPCVTLRDNTERPVTVSEGTNVLAGTDPDAVVRESMKMLQSAKRGRRPELWDGRAAERIIDILERELR